MIRGMRDILDLLNLSFPFRTISMQDTVRTLGGQASGAGAGRPHSKNLTHAFVRARRLVAAEAPHSVPPSRRRPLRRRALLDQGLRERLLPALPSAAADRDARRAALETPGRSTRTQRTAA